MNFDHYNVPKDKSKFTISLHEVLLLFVSLLLCIYVIFFNSLDNLISTFLLFVFISISGMVLARGAFYNLEHVRLQKVLSVIWLLKLIVALLLLHVGWIPDLFALNTEQWGYDPQRYYKYSQDLISNNWEVNFGLNYMGVVYYYAGIFYLFGKNPLVALLINSFFTLLAAVVLIRFLYKNSPFYTRKDRVIVYLLFIPEVLWYDAITSRETLLAFLMIMVTIGIGSKIINYSSNFINSWCFILLITVCIVAVRTSMILPIILYVFLVYFLVSKNERNSFFKRFTLGSSLLILFSALLVFGSDIQGILGTGTFSFSKELTSRFSSNEYTVIATSGWSENSIGMLLMPENFIQAVIFTPFRGIAYLASPLPNIPVSFSGLSSGAHSAWQYLMVIPTSILMVGLFPFVMSGTTLAWKLRAIWPGLLVIVIAFWAVFISVSGGNLIIHERYRVMFDLLYFSVAWIGYTKSSSAFIQRWFFLWLVVIFFGTIFYTAYKIT